MSEQIQLNINGMSCASCVGRIEKALAKVTGVEQVSVNLASETATVSGLSVSTDLLLAAVEKAGYQASLPEKKNPGQTEADCFLSAGMVACARKHGTDLTFSSAYGWFTF